MTRLPESGSIVLASGNAGKLRELEILLKPLGFELKLQSEFDVEDADETGLTFIENAIIKARHASAITGLPAIADDSGIEVDALLGAPGIYSARFASIAGAGAGDLDNNALLLKKLSGLPEEQRTARFRCALVLIRHPADPAPLIAEGSWEGHILETASGSNGFGYDPLFFAHEQGRAAAEMAATEKARVSHRGQAMAELQSKLQSNLQP